jgi:hypothetical protein
VNNYVANYYIKLTNVVYVFKIVKQVNNILFMIVVYYNADTIFVIFVLYHITGN